MRRERWVRRVKRVRRDKKFAVFALINNSHLHAFR